MNWEELGFYLVEQKGCKRDCWVCGVFSWKKQGWRVSEFGRGLKGSRKEDDGDGRPWGEGCVCVVVVCRLAGWGGWALGWVVWL